LTVELSCQVELPCIACFTVCVFLKSPVTADHLKLHFQISAVIRNE